MSINENIYGDSEEWADYLYENCKQTDYALWSKVLSNDWEMNKLIDNSICYFGAIGNFYTARPLAFFSASEIIPVYNDDSVYNIVFMLSLSRDGWNYSCAPAGYTNDKWSHWVIPDMADYCCQYLIRSLFNFKLNNLLFIPYVTACTDAGMGGSYHDYTLGEWIESGHNDYPYLNSCYMIPYYNHGTMEEPDWRHAIESADHYFFAQRNAEFTEEFSDRGDRNVISTYCIGGDPARRARIIVMGFSKPDASDIDDYKPIGFDPDISHYIFDDPDTPTQVKYSRQYSEDLVKEIYTQIAFYGVFFLGEGSDDFTDVQLTSERVYLGTVDEGGYTYGRYTHGEDNADQPQYRWADTSESDYDSKARIDPNIYNGSMSTGELVWFENPTPKYNIASINFHKLTDKLWDAMALVPSGDPINDYCLDTFLTQNPIDTIVSLKYFPISEAMGIGDVISVQLGKFDTEIPALAAKQDIKYDCGVKLIYPRFGNGEPTWIDKLTTITLYLPFCGVVQLDADKYMGRYVGVEYLIDLNTGNCSASVYTFRDLYSTTSEKIYTEVANGTCAVDLPVTGIQHITLDSQLYNATEQLKNMRVNTAVQGLTSVLGLSSAPSKGLSGGISQLASAGLGIYNNMYKESVAEYNLQHTQLPVKNIGSTGAMTGVMLETYPTLIFERPVISINKKSYGHTIGYACCISAKIGSFKGYTEFANADLSGIAAPAAVKEMIMQGLKAGIIL